MSPKTICHCGRKKARQAAQCMDCRFGIEPIESQAVFVPTTPRELMDTIVSQCRGEIS
jgi:hypothetical protein